MTGQEDTKYLIEGKYLVINQRHHKVFCYFSRRYDLRCLMSHKRFF